MIHGFFDPTEPAQRPWVSGLLYLPRLGLTRAITFEIDTGADMSMLSFQDRVGFIDPDQVFEGTDTGSGTAGSSSYGNEKAVVAFQDVGSATGWYGRAITLWIALNARESPSFSLLGRDFLQDVVLSMDMSTTTVEMKPLVPLVPVPPPAPPAV